MSRSFYDIDPLLTLVAEGYTLLTPTARLSRRISAQWHQRQQAEGRRVWQPLPVQPLDSWLAEQWQLALARGMVAPLAPLPVAQQLLLWQQVIAEQERQSGDYHLLRPAAAAELASQARDNLLRWEQELTDETLRQQFSFDTDCATFLRWLDLFEMRLAEGGMCTRVDCTRALLACAGELPPLRVALIEFDDIPPLFRSVLAARCEQLREYQPSGDQARCLAHSFKDKRSELQAIALWARQLQREQPESGIGIVLSDMEGDRTALEYLLRREFDCLGENYNALPVNFSTGITLDRAPVVRDALLALGMGMQRSRVVDVVQLLHSRFLQLPDATTPLADCFIKCLYDAGREEVDPGDLRYRAAEVSLGSRRGLALGECLLAVSGMRELRRAWLPSAWVGHFNVVLDQWGWPGQGPLDSLEYQQVELWYRTLDEFKAYDAVCAPLTFEDALQLLRQTCSAQVSQPRTTDSTIQVLGQLEAAGLGFDHLWVAGMQAGAWPGPARPNPFVPVALQRKLQMPHATPEREWNFSSTLFGQYLRASAEVHASYCQQLDGIPELPSALLDDFSWQDVAEPLPVAARWQEQWLGRDLEWLEDERAPPASQAELADTRGGSALLEDQSQCPFRAFARRRLAVEPLSAFSVALSPGERGALLHDALYSLWGSISDHQTLRNMDDLARGQAIDAAVASAVEAVPGSRRRVFGRAYWRLESKRLSALLGEWLAIERTRGDFVVSRRETEVSLQLGRLQIELRVDRIDQLADGSELIIDYKSGRCRVQDWLGERPAKPQLLLYGIAAPESAGALAFAQLRPRDCRFVGLGPGAEVPGIQEDISKAVGDRMAADDWQSLNACWAGILQRLADEFVSGQAQVDPLGPDSCSWCGLQPLCRIGLDEEAAP